MNPRRAFAEALNQAEDLLKELKEALAKLESCEEEVADTAFEEGKTAGLEEAQL